MKTSPLEKQKFSHLAVIVIPICMEHEETVNDVWFWSTLHSRRWSITGYLQLRLGIVRIIEF